ncbi:transposon Ty3-I Gag-Pol polyprotein [Trichonephila clavipes]|nr:transposon Ty3-I Gag-Pol polyprotein [Trichonephila clavipes]
MQLKLLITCKRSLVDVVTLAHPLKNATLLLMVDASDLAIGGVLQQATNCSIQPLAFFSRKLTPPKSRYSTSDHEFQKVDKLSPRQQRHLEFIGEFTTGIKHITSSKNCVADALSRINEIVFPSKIDFNEMAKEQLDDVGMHSELQKFKVETKQITLDSGSSVL